MIRCPICKNKVELEDTDETIDCECCGYHYLDRCPKCGAKFNFEGMNVMIFDGDKWEWYHDDDLRITSNSNSSSDKSESFNRNSDIKRNKFRRLKWL